MTAPLNHAYEVQAVPEPFVYETRVRALGLLTEFLQRTYEAASKLGGWDRVALTTRQRATCESGRGQRNGC